MNMEEQQITSEQSENESSIDYLALFSAVWSKRKIILIVVAASTLASVIISLLLQETFLSTTVLLPETDKSKLASLGGLSDLASLAGVNISGGEGSLVKLYPTIIKSEAVLKNVIENKYQTKKFFRPVNLIEYWEIEEKTPERSFEVALKSLRDELSVSMDNKTSVITLAISTPEPQLSADILNVVTKELDSFIRSKRSTSAGEQRKFVEARLAEVKGDLTRAENALKEFREKNRQVLSPQLLLEQERFIRDVQINATVYTELRKQFEIVKIEEVKNIPVINVMDAARAAAKKEKPKRSIIVLTVFFLSCIGSVGYVVVQAQYGEKITSMLAAVRTSMKL